jgi:hypothetical protein
MVYLLVVVKHIIIWADTPVRPYDGINGRTTRLRLGFSPTKMVIGQGENIHLPKDKIGVNLAGNIPELGRNYTGNIMEEIICTRVSNMIISRS